MWIAVRQRFQAFYRDLKLTEAQIEDGIGKAIGVGKALERAYNGGSSDKPPIFFVGSWGKGTQVRPSGDVDIMAVFDWSVYQRFEERAGNKQSQLLQEIKGHLLTPYPQTDIRGDGQVVVVGFNSITVELVPVFRLESGQYLMPDTNDGGRWKIVDPWAQINLIDEVDKRTSGNTRALTKMVKSWKHEKNVTIKSFLIELLVTDFMNNYQHAHHDYFWYDWFVRDFFHFMKTRAWGQALIPGTSEVVQLGGDWVGKVDDAIQCAEAACNWEYHNYEVTAGQEWQKIFGPRIPTHVL